MPKPPPTSPHMYWQFLRMVRTYWIIVLAILLVFNAGAVSYVIFTAEQRADVGVNREINNQLNTQDPVTIRFTTPMVQSTVANAIQITPPHPYQLTWTDDSQLLSIIPEVPWAHDTVYTIHIVTSAQSQSGRRISSMWSTQFVPQRVVQIRQVLPSPNQVDVARDSMIVVRFGQQMVTQTEAGRTLRQAIVQVFPPVQGVTKWLDVRTLAFQADELSPNQEYAVTVPSQLRDVNGAPLQSSYTWRFRTIATRIERSMPAPNSQEVGLQQSVVMTMTGQIDAIRLAQTLTISPTIEHQLAVTPLDNRHARIDITPTPGWQSDTVYYITIGGGDSTLAPFSTAFRTVSALQLVARTPGEDEIVGRDLEVRFIFNTLLDTSTITDAITITPAPIQPARITTTGRDIRIAANWEVQVNPLIQISSALRNTNGISLTTPISSELRIDQRQALVTLPGIPGEIYDASPTNTFQLQTIPNRTAVLRIYDIPVATLIRMLDMDVETFLSVDPARYNLPLLAQQDIQGSDENSRITIDITRGVSASPLSRIWLVQLISANGSQDIRLMRTRPATLYAVSLPNYIAVGVYETQSPQPNRTILLFQSGQLVGQGVSDERGIWQTPRYATSQQFVVVDPQQPIDVYKLTTLPPIPSSDIHFVLDRNYAERGDILTALIVRPLRDTNNAMLRIRHKSGELLNEQRIVFDTDERTVSTRIQLPNQLTPGLYTVELAIDNQSAQQTFLVYAHHIDTLRIAHTTKNNIHTLTARDEYGQVLSNQPVYWHTPSSNGTGFTDSQGEITIPQTPYDTTVMIDTTHGSRIYIIPTPVTPQLEIINTQHWGTNTQPQTITLQIHGDQQTRAERRIFLTAQNSTGQIIPQPPVITNTDGITETQLLLPDGAWNITATSGDLRATHTLWVGMIAPNETFAPEYTTLTLGQTPRWMISQSAAEQALVAQSLQQEINVDWWQPDATGIIASTPVSLTGTLHSVLGHAGKPYYHSVQQVVDPQCATTLPIVIDAREQQIRIQFQYMPNSRIVFNAFDPVHRQLLIGGITTTTDESGVATWQIKDNGITNKLYMSVIASNNTCQFITNRHIPLSRTQTLIIDAPPIVRIGDIVDVRAIIRDANPQQASRLHVVPDGLQILDTLPQYSIISDDQGNATITWRYRVTAANARLTLDSMQSPTIVWQPTVIVSPVTYSHDGFVLRGTTSLEKGSEPPILLDIIATPQQLQQALTKTPYDQANPSHVAHRLWHTLSPTDQLMLMQQLTQLQLDDGSWAWVGSQTPDALVTADVVIALTQAQYPMQSHQRALRYLQLQLQNPQLTPTTRAIVGYALALNQQLPASDLLALSRAPHLLGNEGLAALLLSMPTDYAYAIPPVLTELLQRAQSAPRGLWWAGDSATASLHSRENVNALIYQALAQLNIAPDERTQLGTQLLSMRGVDGWTDSISNARIWAQHDKLLPQFTTNNFISILNETGQTIHTGIMSPAQPVIQNSRIQSNGQVVVGIARPRNVIAPTGEAAVWLQMYRTDGSLVEDEATFMYGEEVIVSVSMAFFSTIPHVTIIDPQSSLSTLMTQPNNPAMMSVRIMDRALTLHATIDTPQVIQYRYRIRMNHAGRSLLEPIEIRDGSGTVHAQSQTVMVYVVTP